ncbi:MAG: GyrI-like domain-containing protein [Prevotella sp.]|jgi:hypothetical protein|nr:GyrI-like domain-containing protein [Prevotella sp.]
MKKALITILFIVVFLIISLMGVYTYYGGFSTITFEVKETGGEVFVYESVTGYYSQSPVYMDSIYDTLLHDFGIETTRGAGLYLDNPQHVDKDKLRAEVGCLLDNPIDSAQMADISKVFKIKILPKASYIVGEFPHKGMMSVFVGIMRVYPALTEYMEENGYKDNSPVMEIYDIPKERIIYRKEVTP